jgi:hypothetical protein
VNGKVIPDDWAPRLASAISAAMREFAPLVGAEPLAMLALDCHPWHGTLGLAALTAREVASDNLLADPAEMAAWRYFDFAQEFPSWKVVSDLGKRMRLDYEAGDRLAVAEAFMRACAAAISSKSVGDALAAFVRTDGFRLSVAHPDDRREFVGTAGGPDITSG